jgi:hypothetical protein
MPRPRLLLTVLSRMKLGLLALVSLNSRPGAGTSVPAALQAMFAILTVPIWR